MAVRSLVRTQSLWSASTPPHSQMLRCLPPIMRVVPVRRRQQLPPLRFLMPVHRLDRWDAIGTSRPGSWQVVRLPDQAAGDRFSSFPAPNAYAAHPAPAALALPLPGGLTQGMHPPLCYQLNIPAVRRRLRGKVSRSIAAPTSSVRCSVRPVRRHRMDWPDMLCEGMHMRHELALVRAPPAYS